MKCHYEVLDVPRNARDFEIKVAYRKLALKWHPHKNLDNPEYANEQFLIVQQAYAVLGNRQERAWYDKHREEILSISNSEFQHNRLDVLQYFTTTCFNGYSDNENGFYTVYRNVFESVAREDLEFTEEKEEFFEIPSFGHSQTDYESICRFYVYWMNYSTKKSYVCPYDIRKSKHRRCVKLMHKKNEKVRQKARKQRNEEIRKLVEFVRKLDKRALDVREIGEKKFLQFLEDTRKWRLLSIQKRLERQQLNESKTEPELVNFDDVQLELEKTELNVMEKFGEEFSNSENEEEAENFPYLYCMVCSKLFKSAKTFENHEFSKKHKYNIEILKKNTLDEKFTICYNSQGDNPCQIENGSMQDNSGTIEEVIKSKQKK